MKFIVLRKGAKKCDNCAKKMVDYSNNKNSLLEATNKSFRIYCTRNLVRVLSILGLKSEVLRLSLIASFWNEKFRITRDTGLYYLRVNNI
jgi:hypothetical protein